MHDQLVMSGATAEPKSLSQELPITTLTEASLAM